MNIQFKAIVYKKKKKNKKEKNKNNNNYKKIFTEPMAPRAAARAKREPLEVRVVSLRS